MTSKRDRPADEIEITPAMLQAGQDRLSDIGEASSAYLAEEAFLAMMEVALRCGVYVRAGYEASGLGGQNKPQRSK